MESKSENSGNKNTSRDAEVLREVKAKFIHRAQKESDLSPRQVKAFRDALLDLPTHSSR